MKKTDKVPGYIALGYTAPPPLDQLPAVPTKLEGFLRTRDLKPAHVSRESNYSRQHLLRIRMGRMDPARHCVAIASACRRLSHEAVKAAHLFDLDDADA